MSELKQRPYLPKITTEMLDLLDDTCLIEIDKSDKPQWTGIAVDFVACLPWNTRTPSIEAIIAEIDKVKFYEKGYGYREKGAYAFREEVKDRLRDMEE